MSRVSEIWNRRVNDEMPFTRGELAAQRARETDDFHTLSWPERDRRVMEAMRAA